ncbi:MAG: HNH endonuclease [Proteobacteria bacterium]|nr:MAG: HNH endonuclease [Pseudomonadota bacterium]
MSESAEPIGTIRQPKFVITHERAMRAASNYKKSQTELLDVIFDVEDQQIYLQMQIKSLYQYCVEMLGLSEATAYSLIAVMRKSREVPALKESVVSGRVTLSKARKICSVITVKNQKEWLDLARVCSARIVERAVAMASPRSAVPESMKYVAEDTLEFKLAVSGEWSQLLADVKDLMSQAKRRAVSSEEALFKLLQNYKIKNDPVEKAKRALTRKADSPLLQATDCSREQLEPETKRTRHIPARTLHLVNLRDQGRCSFVDRHGKRCGEKRWIDKHHVQPFSEGGDHSVENLQTLCWAHHRMMHR